MAPVNALRVVGVATLCADVYVFSRWHYRPKVDRDPNDTSGQAPPEDPRKLRQHLQDMDRHWTASLRNLGEGRWYTLVTSAFSHADPMHLAANVWGLVQVYRMMRFLGAGAPRVVALGLGSAVAGNAAYLWDRATRPEAWERAIPGFGSSAIITGMATAAAVALPYLPMGIPFVAGITFPLRNVMLTITAVDAVGLLWDRSQRGRGPGERGSQVGYAAHLGGTVFGAVFSAVFLRRYSPRIRR